MNRFALALAISMLLAGFSGCSRTTRQQQASFVPSKYYSSLSKGQVIQPGVIRYKVIQFGVHNDTLWIYLPEKPPKTKLPCVFIAPAGTPLIYGSKLNESDTPEHIPYAKAGFAVVAYELDGDIPASSPVPVEIIAIEEFKRAKAGLANARNAIDYALHAIPNIDPKRLYTAGHSSAATTSLLVASWEPKIAACIAYAPCCDIRTHLGEEAFQDMHPVNQRFVIQASPITSVERLTCPVFFFQADDDPLRKTSALQPYLTELKKTNSQVTVVRVPSGGHYDSMTRQGIPKAITWLKQLP